MSDVLILDKHKDLFKDEESLQKFAKVLQEATQDQEMLLVLFGERLMGAIISLAEAQKRLRERITIRLRNNPGSIETLRDRLQSDDVVE
jgi:hypothetical protein